MLEKKLPMVRNLGGGGYLLYNSPADDRESDSCLVQNKARDGVSLSHVTGKAVMGVTATCMLFLGVLVTHFLCHWTSILQGTLGCFLMVEETESGCEVTHWDRTSSLGLFGKGWVTILPSADPRTSLHCSACVCVCLFVLFLYVEHT